MKRLFGLRRARYFRRAKTRAQMVMTAIKQNPIRKAKQPIDWALCKERHLVECFFNRIKRFRRIVLRCA